MKQDGIVWEYFNGCLKIGIFTAIILISTGGMIYLVHHAMQNYHLDNDTIIYIHATWLLFIRVGIFLLIILQILRVLFFSIMFLLARNLALSLMSLFIAVLLAASMLFVVLHEAA